MSKILSAALIGAAALALSGCAGLSAFNTALIPTLKPIGAGIEPTMKCADQVDRVASADTKTQMSVDQLKAMVRTCEEMQAGNRVIIDPQGARKVIDAAITKGPAGLAAGALVAPVMP
jgi:hypothetical protein